jgi:hypothetical protein
MFQKTVMPARQVQRMVRVEWARFGARQLSFFAFHSIVRVVLSTAGWLTAD